jgi:hypothetical protein
MAVGDYTRDEDGTWLETEDGFVEVFQDANGGYWYEADDGSFQALETPEQTEARAFSMDAMNQLNALEHRLGRPLSGTEADLIIEDMGADPAGADAAGSYLSYFNEDRTRDDDDRKELLGEVMDDVQRHQEAQEANYGDGEGVGFEDYEEAEAE